MSAVADEETVAAMPPAALGADEGTAAPTTVLAFDEATTLGLEWQEQHRQVEKQ